MDVGDRVVAGLVAGLPARIVLRSQADRGLGGKILRVEPVADPVTEEVLAKVSFDTAIIVVTHDEKVIPTFRRLYNIREGITVEEQIST